MTATFGNRAKKEDKLLYVPLFSLLSAQGLLVPLRYPSISTDPSLPYRCACGACDKTFKKVREAVAHAATHERYSSELICPLKTCDFKTEFLRKMYDHIWSSKHKNLDELYVSLGCCRIYIRQENLKAHQSKSHDPNCVNQISPYIPLDI